MAKMLKWKRPDRPHHQVTHCGRYWVERDPDGGHFNRWHAHRIDIDEQLTFDGFETREEAKAYCEEDANEEARNSARADTIAG
jgi:DNA-binding PadR family transcriptional regulator